MPQTPLRGDGQKPAGRAGKAGAKAWPEFDRRNEDIVFWRYVLAYLIVIPTAMLCLAPMKNQLRYGPGRTHAIVMSAVTVMSFVTAWLSMKCSFGENDLLIPLLLICFVLYAWCVRAPFSKKIGAFLLVQALLSILSNIAICINVLMGPSFSSEAGQMRSSVIHICLGCGFMAPLTFVFNKFGSRVVDQPMRQRGWGIFTLLSLGLFILNLLLQPAQGVQEAMSRDSSKITILLASFCILLAIWSLYLIGFYYIIMDTKKAAELSARNDMLELQAYQFDSQQRYLKVSEQARHDMRHNLRTLSGLYDAGDYEALGKYLHQMENEMPVKEIFTYTDHTALNAVLNFYAHTSQLNRVDYQVKVRLPDVLPLSDVDLCSMVSNILENASIASKRAEEPSISITILAEEGGQLYIVAENTFDGYIRENGGTYASTNRKGGGIGLASVAATAEKYGGVAQFSHEGKTFFSNVAIPLTDEIVGGGGKEA